MNYLEKYLKYKEKYLNLKITQSGQRYKAYLNLDGGAAFIPAGGAAADYAPPTNHPMFRTKLLPNQANQRIIFDIVPVAAYNITDIGRYVVQYRFTRRNINTEEMIQCMINFYLSDGQTNGFNSGSLFPFFAIDEGTGDGPKSNRVHVSRDRPGLLCKLNNPLKYVRETFHSEWIRNGLEADYGVDRTNIFYRNEHIQRQNVGVSSVLARGEDPLSLFMASSSVKVSTYRGGNGHLFAPNTGNRSNWAPSDNTSIGRYENVPNLPMYNAFRDMIARVLGDYHRCMCREIIDQTEPLTRNIPFTPITLADFNLLDGVALLDGDGNMGLLQAMEDNIQQYFQFVVEFSMCIGQYFSNIPGQVPGEQLTGTQHFVRSFFNLFDFRTISTAPIPGNILRNLIRNWGLQLPHPPHN
jgi:hypothetical protein